MINIDLRDPHAAEKAELYFKLKRAGVISNEEALPSSAGDERMVTAALLMAESEELDSKARQVCPFWWNSRSEEGLNGTIDTFSCKEDFCTNVMITRPYSDEVLRSGLKAQCQRANNASDEKCKLFKAYMELARRKNNIHRISFKSPNFSLKEGPDCE